MRRFTQYSRLTRPRCTTFIVAVIAGLGGLTSGCFDPDPRTLGGALDAAARAVEAGDGRALFRVTDQRARDAIVSIVKDRSRAVRLIRADYPPAERSVALRALGDAAAAKDAPDLFAKRCCGAACMAKLAAELGAPVSHVERGDELEVHTTRGGSLRLRRGRDGWWGIVWNTTALFDERTRAARELVQIRANAEIYRRRRALESQ
jgi:hypothetical protein